MVTGHVSNAAHEQVQGNSHHAAYLDSRVEAFISSSFAKTLAAMNTSVRRLPVAALHVKHVRGALGDTHHHTTSLTGVR